MCACLSNPAAKDLHLLLVYMLHMSCCAFQSPCTILCASFLAVHQQSFWAACRYKTPNLTDIDHEGLHPDESCSPLGLSSAPGAVPITEDALASLGSKLALDSCVLTAENFLDQQLGISTMTTQEHDNLTKNLLVGKEQQDVDKMVQTQQLHS